MHFEVLVEDASGKIVLDRILEPILGPEGEKHTYRVHAYKGIGRLPRDLKGSTDPSKRILLDRLPNILAGYGKSLPKGKAAVIVVVDLDDRSCTEFKHELKSALERCDPAPEVLFRIAVEEIESWLLGDPDAVKAAYPGAKESVLSGYRQDSICGTWEKLADALVQGGAQALKKQGWVQIGRKKCEWAEKIAPFLGVDRNRSKSFQVFRDGLRRLAG